MSARRRIVVLAVVAAACLLGAPTAFAGAGPRPLAAKTPIRLSSDPFTNPGSQHRTEVEPDSFAFGSTIIAAFQMGRFFDGGSSSIGFARSGDGGAKWTHGVLPAITRFTPGGQYDRASDPSVAYDARHKTWLVSSLAIVHPTGGASIAADVVASRSTDGGVHWAAPVPVARGADLDKNWSVCDNTATSPNYGNCYTEYDDAADGNKFHMAVTADAGAHWTEASVPTATSVVGGQPVVRPDGVVVVPILHNGFGGSGSTLVSTIENYTSSPDGRTYTAQNPIHSVKFHKPAGSLRSGTGMPSAAIDGAGRIYVVWPSCGARKDCAANDLVLSTSDDGVTWTTPKVIPLDNASADHFIPGLAADHATSGASAHLAIAYYFYPNPSCTVATCKLFVGMAESKNGGATWTRSTRLAGMYLGWLPNTSEGFMVGDYISTSFADHVAHPVFAVARAKSKGSFDEAIYTTP